MNGRAGKGRLFRGLFYALAFWLLNLLAQAYRLSAGRDFLGRLAALAIRWPGTSVFSLEPHDLLFAAAGTAACWGLLQIKRMEAKNYRRKGVEFGSARWGGPKDIAPFIDPIFRRNVLLTRTERLRMGPAPTKELNRNLNVLVVGGSGSGKTRFFVEPNLMQCHSSYVVTDSKGGILRDVGHLLQTQGIRLKIFNLIDFNRSMHYNPFAYLRSEKDILTLSNALIANTRKPGKTGGDPFWEDAERLLYCALIGYIWYEAPEEEQNMGTLLEMLDSMDVREDDDEYRNAVDWLFAELAQRQPRHFAVRQYKKYKLAAGKTAKSILISCGARLAPFDIQEVRDLTACDELELDTIGDRKTALFIMVSDTDPTFNFLAAMLYTQLFNLLCDKADKEYGGRLPVHVQCLLDEFANIGQIPNFDRLISTIRSRNISACILLQSQSQLKAIYRDKTDTITDNCDSQLFLGGQGRGTLKSLTEQLGRETIDFTNESDSRGAQPSRGVSTQKTGRALMTMDELARLGGGQCILRLRGVRPFRSGKYDITSHPAYRYLAETSPRNAFDVAKFLGSRPRLRLRPDDLCTVYDAGRID